MKDRPEYPLNVIINQHEVTRVIVDQHYREKHTDVTDSIILGLIKTLDGQSFPVESTRGEFKYFRAEPVFLPDDPGMKPYRLVLVLCMSDDFLGVVNAFRVQGSTE